MAAAAAVALIAGCTTGGATEEVKEEPEGPANLVFWNTGSDEHAAALNIAAAAYKQKNPNVTVKVQAISWDDGKAKVLTAANSKSGPDIVSGGLSWGIEFGELGGMLDLNKYGAEEVKAKTQPLLWKSITSRGGEVYGVPFDMAVYVLYYRTDLLKKAGVTPPKTWDELQAAVPKLKAAGVKTPLVEDWSTFEWLPWFNYLKQAGGNLYTDDCSKPTIDSPEAVLATTKWADQYRKLGVPKAAVDTGAGMAKGDYAMAIGPSWLVSGLDSGHPAIKGKWEISTLPTGPAGAGSFAGGRIVGAMSYTKYPKAAADFIKWLNSDEAVTLLQKEILAKSGELWMSPRTDLVTQLQTTDNIKQTLQTTMETASGPPNCKGWETSGSEVTKKLQGVVNDNVDPKKALSEAAQIMTRNLA